MKIKILTFCRSLKTLATYSRIGKFRVVHTGFFGAPLIFAADDIEAFNALDRAAGKGAIQSADCLAALKRQSAVRRASLEVNTGSMSPGERRA